MSETLALVVPIEGGKEVTCWAGHCTATATWMVNLSYPILGLPDVGIALCDVHLYDFETSTTVQP